MVALGWEEELCDVCLFSHSCKGTMEGYAYRYPDQGGMRLDPSLVIIAPEAEAADDGGYDELRGQDGVHCRSTRCQRFILTLSLLLSFVVYGSM